MTEEEFVESFGEFMKENCKTNVHLNTNNNSSNMDCEFIFNSEYIRLEAKIFNDTRNNSQNILKVFGQILKGRNLKLASNNVNNNPIYYGLLFRKSDLKKINKLLQNISPTDWKSFGKIFECKYIYIYDHRNKQLYMSNWGEFPKYKLVTI